jgi:L-threonylcarbamoyladenylate synthase
LDVFGDEIDLVLDGGRTRGGRGSTVLDVTVDPPFLLREGIISRERIETCLAKRG